MSERIGRILVQRSYVNERKSELEKMFRFLKFTPTRSSPSQDDRILAMVYIGTSPNFKEIEEGDKIPDYIIRVTEDPSSGTKDIRFVKVS